MAYNPTTPASLLEALALDEDWQVRETVADNSSTTAAILETLARDKAWNVRYGVAWHPSTPVHVLEALVQDEDQDEDQEIRAQAQGSLDALRAAAVDPAGRVRIAAARGAGGIEH